MAFNNFDNTKRKRNYLWNKINAQSDTVNHLHKNTIILNDTVFTKSIFKQQIITATIIQTATTNPIITKIVDFPFLPSWAIPMVKIIPVVKFSDIYRIEDVGISQLLTKKLWTELGQDHYQLKLTFQATIFGTSENPLTYLNCWLYIINENDYFLTQTEGI